MRTGKVTAVVAALVLIGTGCGEDDGGSVREIGGDEQSGSGSGSASASASGSGSASAPASGSASGSGDAGECVVEGGASGEATYEIHGELTEFEITIDATTAPEGLVTFEFENAGAVAHEVAVVRGDDPSALPTGDDGAADDEALGDALVGEIEPFASGATCAGTFDLSPGTYVLLCNVVEEDGGEHAAHFEEGMFTTLTVTG